jgi:proteasome accessory factor C
MAAPKTSRRKPTTGPVAALRRMLLLIPAAWKAGPEGLPLEKAVKLTGARNAKELQELVTSVGALDLGPSMPEDFLAVSIVGDRVVVDRGLHLVSPPALSLREGAALAAALRPFADGRSKTGGGKAVAAALRKLARAVPEPIRQKADRLSRAMDFQIDPPGIWADSLAEAIERRLEVAIEYRAENVGTAGQRTLEPRVMFHQDGHWYLAAWNVEKGEEHLFRFDRIASVVIGTRVFGEHKGPPLERYRTRHLYFQSGGEREVKVRFTGPSAAQVVEQWPEQASRNEDGSVTISARITPGNYLYGWVLGYGGQAEIESPAEARSALASRVDELKKLYADA